MELLQRNLHVTRDPIIAGTSELSPDVLPGDGTDSRWLELLETAYLNTTLCLRPVPADDLEKPMLEVEKYEHVTDGPCFFNYHPTCVLAHRVRDFMVYPIPFGRFYATFPPVATNQDDLHTLPGVAPLDAKLCLDMGWLDLSDQDELLLDYDSLDKKAKDHCTSLREKVPEYKNLTYQDYVDSPKILGNWLHPGAVYPGATLSRLEWYENLKCNMGHYAVACDMANCLYTFCRMPDGRIGSGRQCRKNWMNVEGTKSHLRAYDPFIPDWQTLLSEASIGK